MSRLGFLTGNNVGVGLNVVNVGEIRSVVSYEDRVIVIVRTPRGLWQKRGNSLKNLFRKTQPQPIARSFFAATRRGAVSGAKKLCAAF